VKTFFLNVWFYAAFAVFAVLDLPVFTALSVADRLLLPQRKAARRLRLRIHRFGRQVVWLLRPVAPVVREGEGWEPLVGGVYVANHRSFSDPWLISQLPRAEMVQIVNRWPFKIPVLGLVAKCAGYLDIKGMTLDAFLETGAKLLNDKVTLVSFPEGTRSRDGSLGAFHGEIFRLIKQTGATVVPLVITGHERTPARGSMVLRPTKIRMRLLPPLTVAEYGEWSPFKLKETVRDRIRDASQNMEGERPREPQMEGERPREPQQGMCEFYLPSSATEVMAK
jgi:1-acyl-sn-glycerol-3-phosphate acyltransferase